MRSLFSNDEYIATATDWENFMSSRIWHDIQLFISDRVAAVKDELVLTDEERQQISKDTDRVYEGADILRGRVREANDILLAPEIILEELSEREEKSDD